MVWSRGFEGEVGQMKGLVFGSTQLTLVGRPATFDMWPRHKIFLCWSFELRAIIFYMYGSCVTLLSSKKFAKECSTFV